MLQDHPLVTQIVDQLSTVPVWVLASIPAWFLMIPFLLPKRKRRSRTRRQLRKTTPVALASVKPSEPAKTGQGMQALQRCTVRVRPIMSREQAGVHSLLDRFTRDRGLILSSEVSLSAILTVHHAQQSTATAGFASVRQKYLDFLITDSDHLPICAVEYHGSGHWQGNAAERDALKAKAFRLAGLPLVIVDHGYDASEVLNRVATAVGDVPHRVVDGAFARAS